MKDFAPSLTPPQGGKLGKSVVLWLFEPKYNAKNLFSPLSGIGND
jgi:hypothetical protein